MHALIQDLDQFLYENIISLLGSFEGLGKLLKPRMQVGGLAKIVLERSEVIKEAHLPR